MFNLNSTLNFGIPPVLVFLLEVYYKVDRLLTGLAAQQKGTTARWYSNKTSLVDDLHFSWPIAMLWSSFLLKSLWSIYITLKRDKIFFSINILILLSICPYCL